MSEGAYEEIVFVAIGLLAATTASGIDVAVGPKVLVGYFDVHGDDYEDTLSSLNGSRRFSFGYSGGGFVEIGILPFLAIQPEILVDAGGPGFKYETTAGTETGTVKAWADTYAFDFPILVKGKFPVGSVVLAIYSGVGVQVRFATWTTNESSDNDTIESALKAAGSTMYELESADFAADYGFSLVGGAEVEFAVWRGILMVGTRYTHGLTEWFTDDDSKYRTFFVSVGYAFKLM